MVEFECECPDVLQPFGIGSKVWSYDRWARRGEDPVVELEVTGETSRSWVLEAGTYREVKLPKKDIATGVDYVDVSRATYRGRETQRYYINKKAMDDARWASNNRYAIGEHVKNAKLSAEVLREVAKLVGYEEKKED